MVREIHLWLGSLTQLVSTIFNLIFTGNVKVVVLWNNNLEQYFPHLLELVPDPSLLGNELMNMISSLAISDINTPKDGKYVTLRLLLELINLIEYEV